ncbi:MAG: DJ-1/PfpI family protein [Candidatus Peregrinibacteria bacterium]
MKPILIILAQSGYQDLEYLGTREALEQGGFAITVASAAGGKCFGKLGGTVDASLSMKSVNFHDYEAVVFIGGPGAEAYTRNPEALRIAHDAFDGTIPLAAICIAPLILAKARVLEGKRATVWDANGEQAAILTQAKAEYTGERVTVDGLIITANGAEAAGDFGRAIAAVVKVKS